MSNNNNGNRLFDSKFYKRYIKAEERGIVKVWDVLTKVLSYFSILEIIIQYVKWKYKYYEINIENESATLNDRKELNKERILWQ